MHFKLKAFFFKAIPQVTQAYCVCSIGKYGEHMRESLGLGIC